MELKEGEPLSRTLHVDVVLVNPYNGIESLHVAPAQVEAVE
jgi:hypothetical protein